MMGRVVRRCMHVAASRAKAFAKLPPKSAEKVCPLLLMIGPHPFEIPNFQKNQTEGGIVDMLPCFFAGRQRRLLCGIQQKGRDGRVE
jgi:hypothetical protein